MRALVTATLRFLGASAEADHQPSPPLSGPELRQRVGRWSRPRQLEGETQEEPAVEDEETEDIARRGPSHGIWIAAATFVPTFLATFFGVVYLAGLPMGTLVPAGLKDCPQPVTSALAPQRDIVATPRQAQAPMRKALGNAAVPATTAAISRPASGATRPQVAPNAAEPKRSTSTVTKDDVWVRAAAFSDRDSAERLAASIVQEGYPAKVRRGDTPNERWVVWIGKHPKGLTPSERRK